MRVNKRTKAQAVYGAYLKHPKWISKKLEIMARDNFECQYCHIAINRSLLDVHHKTYLPGRLPWQYDNSYLITLCRNCHDREHEIERVLMEEDLRRALNNED